MIIQTSMIATIICGCGADGERLRGTVKSAASGDSAGIGESTTVGKPDKAWRYLNYDVLGSRVYPYPSKPMGECEFELTEKGTPRTGYQYSRNLLAGDIDDDDTMEICMSYFQEIIIYNPELSIVRSIVIRANATLSLLQDYDGDGGFDIAVGSMEEYDPEAIIFNSKGDTLWRQEIACKNKSNIAPRLILPDKDLIAVISIGYGRRVQRGLARFEARSGEQQWSYGIGSGLDMVSAADIDGDGIMEISLFTGSPENGNVGHGGPYGGTTTYDDCSYTIIIDENGKEEYTIRETSKRNDGYTAKFVTLRENGPYSLLCYTNMSSNLRPATTSKIMIRKATNGSLMKTFYGKASYSFEVLACDLDNDGVKELIASNYSPFKNDAYFSEVQNYIITSELEVLRFTRDVPGRITTANDLNGDGRIEFIFGTEGGLIIITDDHFNELWRHDFNEVIRSNIIVVDADLDGYNEIYLVTDTKICMIKALPATE